MSKNAENDSSRQAQRCVGRFFFENGIDFSAATSFTFQEMIDACIVCGCGSSSTSGCKVPSCHDLKGWILEQEMEAIQGHVQEVRHSWGSTGCSILLDGWIDGKGRNLINFLVDSPRGPIFLNSADVSDSIGDVNAMVSLLNEVIVEVGVENVVQIVTYDTSNSMTAVGKIVTEKHRSVFWTVCASYCIGLMLEKIGTTTGVGRRVLSKAKTLTKFIYSHETMLKRMREHTFELDLVVSSSRVKSAMPFLTLENIVSRKVNLETLFSSLAWNSSILASTSDDGRKVVDLVWDTSFWTEAKELLKVSIPLIRTMQLVNGTTDHHKPKLGYIYETMDQTKETMKEEYNDKKAKYMPFWKIIDGIWDTHLHSPVHAAGYFLNPCFFYSSDFIADVEVTSGLLCCIVRMVEDTSKQDLIIVQLDDYRAANGSFGDKAAVHQRTRITPAKWWSLYGSHCPELQKFATRILCQTCTGALKYGLKRGLLSEKLHTKGMNKVEQQLLNDMEFVHHNLRLQQFSSASNKSYSTNIFLEEIDPMDEWVGGGGELEEMAQQNYAADEDDEHTTQSKVSKKEQRSSALKPLRRSLRNRNSNRSDRYSP